MKIHVDENSDLTFLLNTLEFVEDLPAIPTKDAYISIQRAYVEDHFAYFVPMAYCVFDSCKSWYIPFQLEGYKVYLDASY